MSRTTKQFLMSLGIVFSIASIVLVLLFKSGIYADISTIGSRIPVQIDEQQGVNIEILDSQRYYLHLGSTPKTYGLYNIGDIYKSK